MERLGSGDEELACPENDVIIFKRDLLTSGTDKQYRNERKNIINNMRVGNPVGFLF